MSDPMRVKLDRTVCDGFGICARHAPEYFLLDDWDYASLAGDGTVAESDRSAVTRALLDCPVHAITELGGHPPSRPRPRITSAEAPEPEPSTTDNEAISEFLR